jgi:phosphate transport system protein
MKRSKKEFLVTGSLRSQFDVDLQAIDDQLVEMTRLVGSAMHRATTALLDADLAVAESVIGADEQIDALHVDLEERALVLIARQAPVATDLRVLIAALRMSADLERMGDLARHVAKLARLRYPNSAVPAGLRGDVLEMGQVAERLVVKAGSIIANRDLTAAQELETDDDEMDRLHRGLFGKLLVPDWSHGIETAIDITLAGRYYERYGDHAVAVARRVVFLVTGDHAAAHGEGPSN